VINHYKMGEPFTINTANVSLSAATSPIDHLDQGVNISTRNASEL
jgi:hypothetical protein